MAKEQKPGRKAGGGAADPGSLTEYLFAEGARSHHAGQFAAAEDRYRQALALAPKHANSLYCLGLIALQTGRNELAVEMLGKAVAVHGREADWHYNLAMGLQLLGRWGEAATHYWRAVAIKPGHV